MREIPPAVNAFIAYIVSSVFLYMVTSAIFDDLVSALIASQVLATIFGSGVLVRGSTKGGYSASREMYRPDPVQYEVQPVTRPRKTTWAISGVESQTKDTAPPDNAGGRSHPEWMTEEIAQKIRILLLNPTKKMLSGRIIHSEGIASRDPRAVPPAAAVLEWLKSIDGGLELAGNGRYKIIDRKKIINHLPHPQKSGGGGGRSGGHSSNPPLSSATRPPLGKE